MLGLRGPLVECGALSDLRVPAFEIRHNRHFQRKQVKAVHPNAERNIAVGEAFARDKPRTAELLLCNVQSFDECEVRFFQFAGSRSACGSRTSCITSSCCGGSSSLFSQSTQRLAEAKVFTSPP